MLQNLKDFNSMPLMSKLNISEQGRNSTIRSRREIIVSQLLLMMTDGENAHQCAKKYTAPRNWEDSRPCTSIDAEQEIGLVLNIGITTVIDVFDIEVQVPSLSSPEYSVWILISRGHERFVNEIHRHNSDIMNCSSSLRTKEENLNNVSSESSKRAVVNHK